MLGKSRFLAQREQSANRTISEPKRVPGAAGNSAKIVVLFHPIQAPV
jgi:hypothetical protein